MSIFSVNLDIYEQRVDGIDMTHKYVDFFVFFRILLETRFAGAGFGLITLAFDCVVFEHVRRRTQELLRRHPPLKAMRIAQDAYCD